MAEQQVSSEQPLAVFDIDALLDEPSEQMQQLRLMQQTRGLSAPLSTPVSSNLPNFQAMEMRLPSRSPHAEVATSPAHRQQEFDRQSWPRSLGEVLVADDEVNHHEGTLGATLREFLQPQNSRGSIKYPASPSDHFSHDSFSPKPRSSPTGSPNEVWKVSPGDSKSSSSPSFNLASLRHSNSSDHLNTGSNFRSSSDNMAGSAGSNASQTMLQSQNFPSAVNFDVLNPASTSYDSHFQRHDSGQMHFQGSQSFDARASSHPLSSPPSNSKALSRSSQELYRSTQLTMPTSPSHQAFSSLLAVGSAGPLSPTHMSASGMRMFGSQSQSPQGDNAVYGHSPSTSSPRAFSQTTMASSFAALGHSSSHENLSLQTIGMLMKSSSNGPPVDQPFSPKSGGSGGSTNMFQSPPRAFLDNVATSPHSQVTPRSGSFSPTAVSGASSTFGELQQQLQLQQTFVVDMDHESHGVLVGDSAFESQQPHDEVPQRGEQQQQQEQQQHQQQQQQQQHQNHHQQQHQQRRQQQQQRQYQYQSAPHQHQHQQQYQQLQFHHHQQQILQQQQHHQSQLQQQQYYQLQQHYPQYQSSGYQHSTNFPSYPSIPRVMMVLVDQHNNVIPQPLAPNFNPQFSQFVHPMPSVLQSADYDLAGQAFPPHGQYEGMYTGQQMAAPQSLEQLPRQQRSPGSAVNATAGHFQSHAANSHMPPQSQQNQTLSHIKPPPQSGTFIAAQQRSGGKQAQQAVESSSRPSSVSRPGHPVSSITKYTPGSDRVIDVALDQQGSRLIQARLSVSPPAVISAIVDEIISDLHVLTMDVFGNYVVQKAFEYTDLAQQQRVTGMLRGKMVELSMHVYGCRVVQKILEIFDVQFHSLIVDELVEQLKDCVCDPNGNHVVQKAVERASAVLLQPVVDILGQDVFFFATHLYGCRVMQRVLEYCISQQSAPILQLIVESGSELLRDQFGNYVVQHVIECGPSDARSSLLKLMCGDLPELAVHKFASNVVEKVLRSSSPIEVVPLIAEFLTPKRHGAPVPLQTVMRDQFGNYVIQCIIDISQGEQREAIAAYVLSEKEELKKYSYGKHILAHLEKTMPDSSRPRVWNKPHKAKGGGNR